MFCTKWFIIKFKQRIDKWWCICCWLIQNRISKHRTLSIKKFRKNRCNIWIDLLKSFDMSKMTCNEFNEFCITISLFVAMKNNNFSNFFANKLSSNRIKLFKICRIRIKTFCVSSMTKSFFIEFFKINKYISSNVWVDLCFVRLFWQICSNRTNVEICRKLLT